VISYNKGEFVSSHSRDVLMERLSENLREDDDDDDDEHNSTNHTKYDHLLQKKTQTQSITPTANI